MVRRPPRTTQSRSSAASDVYKRQYVYFNIDERALLKYESLAWGSGRTMRPDRIKELKIPVEIGLGNEDGFRHVGVLDFLDNQLDEKTGTLRALSLIHISAPTRLLSISSAVF